jgi:DNA repair protein RecN (Recombination protein N)
MVLINLCLKFKQIQAKELHELHSIASGGELSRILLCLRQISSSTGKISIFLFDEVDTGIGGETALLLGQHLSDLSKKIQVLAITHLPQIAFNADSLIKVEKTN